jgi:hypothetical protein
MVTKIKLITPIQFGDEKITELNIRRPIAKDFRSLTSMEKPFSAMFDFAASLADLPPAVIDKLDVDDVPAVVEVVSGFLSKFPQTGQTS